MNPESQLGSFFILQNEKIPHSLKEKVYNLLSAVLALQFTEPPHNIRNVTSTYCKITIKTVGQLHLIRPFSL